MRLVVQERKRFLRDGLVLLMQREADVEAVATAAGVGDLSTVCGAVKPDVVLLEVDTDEWDPCRLAASLRRSHRQVRFVGLYATERGPDAVRASYAGIRSLVRRGDGIEAILAAVRSAHRRPTIPIRVPSAIQTPGSVTRREVAVLALVGGGWTSREISERLGISYKTVENHKQRIFDKLGVQNQAHAVAVAIRRGIIPAEPATELVS